MLRVIRWLLCKLDLHEWVYYNNRYNRRCVSCHRIEQVKFHGELAMYEEGGE